MKKESAPVGKAGRDYQNSSVSDSPFFRWLSNLEQLDYAFQPIVHPVTGVTYGVEALLRGTTGLGFASPKDLFDCAFEERALFFVDIRLREKAIAKFRSIPDHSQLVLFYNYDPRILEMPDYRPGVTEQLMANSDLSTDQVCLEINEKYQISSPATLNGFVRNLKGRGLRIALDDFGSGYAGFELFYHSEPNFLKFDRFLISGIQSDSRKKSLCSHLVSMCKIQGVTTIAEGIETEAEFSVCRAIGFDLVQGFYVHPPTTEAGAIKSQYEVSAPRQDRKLRQEEDAELVLKNMSRIETISIDDDVRTLLDKFQNQDQTNFFPVLDSNDYPLGIIHERSLKQYIYSPFGKELLANRSITRGLRSFVTPNPLTDINTPQDRILEIFVSNPDCEGVILVQNMKYCGFLDAKSLLGIINEKKIAAARDINPLTGLPGNRVIEEYLTQAMGDGDHYHYFVYFDFDHFKPFNDRYGFRQGDRALTLFAQILRDFTSDDVVAAHIGGDDFFLGVRLQEGRSHDITDLVRQIIGRFTDETKPFFTPEERSRGYFVSTNRENEIREFALLSVSAAVIEAAPENKASGLEQLSAQLARLKKQAKVDRTRIAAGHLDGTRVTHG
ncbi:MAG: GGDEF domain-containing protein [Spirochaetota bacterium]